MLPATTSNLDQVIARARAAQRTVAGYCQERLDELTHAVAWALLEPRRNQQLSAMAVATTGFGNASDKILKNHRKTLGLLRDLAGVRTTGVVRELPDKGITELARPIGVIGVLTPSTNPIATPINNIINALKCGNSIIVSPSPKGDAVFSQLLEYIHVELRKMDAPLDAVQKTPGTPAKEQILELMHMVDLVIVTGSQNNVRAAYSSGTPAIGVGTGNVTTIVDETADVGAAARKIRESKIFDNATSCSSENNLVCLKAVYNKMIASLIGEGGVLLTARQQERLRATLCPQGRLNSELIAKPAHYIARQCAIDFPPEGSFLLVEEEDTSAANPLARERMAPILSLFKAEDFNDACRLARELLENQGAGHSLGIHSSSEARYTRLAHEMPCCRVIVNQAHCFAAGGSFGNGMPFSLSMGCGSWGGNSISDNLNYRHFLNTTRIVREIPGNEPSVESLLGDFWAKYGYG